MVPLKLRPNQDYALSINTERFQNFTNMRGKPAVPYPIRFRTGDGKAKGALEGAAKAKAEAPARTPRVASASPDDGAIDVDPATRELRVSFDQDMSHDSMSILGDGPTFPADPAGEMRWVDARTLMLPLKLEPGRDYELSFNGGRFLGIRNSRGQASVPYPIRFRTGTGKEKGNGAASKLTQRDNREAIQRLKAAIDADYSYRDLHEVDWDAAFDSAADHLAAARAPLEFAKRAALLLAPAKDMHLWLKVGDWQVPSFDRKVTMNMNQPSLERAIPGLNLEGPIAIGRLRNGITYILIATWAGDTMLNAAYEALGEADATKGLIVDVRPNGGGSEPLAQEFAGCFLDATRVYSKHVTRSGGARLADPRPVRQSEPGGAEVSRQGRRPDGAGQHEQLRVVPADDEAGPGLHAGGRAVVRQLGQPAAGGPGQRGDGLRALVEGPAARRDLPGGRGHRAGRRGEGRPARLRRRRSRAGGRCGGPVQKVILRTNCRAWDKWHSATTWSTRSCSPPS